MIDTILALLLLASICLCITWVVLKGISLTMRGQVNRITREIRPPYFKNNMAARIAAIGALSAFGIFCIILELDPTFYPEEEGNLLIAGILFLIFALFRLIFLFRFQAKYRIVDETSDMSPAQVQLLLEYLQIQKPLTDKPEQDIIQALVELMSPNDTRELLEYMINTYKIPCTPIAKETILSSRPRKNLAQLFEMYPVDYIEDEELDWGKPIGDEIW